MVKINTERDLIACIDGVAGKISQNAALKSFYRESLRRLSDFKRILGNVEMRIAIIGITSSGKSTLMNAVLGAKLLPTRVGPSSSKQVLCGWGEKQEGEIVFDPEMGKNTRKLKGTADAIRGELEKYGDEKFNPHNREGVDEIRVTSPGFRFHRDLVIIDTPGLDAYGLDQHKEVTMKLVLPTVDMILFLTNVKCDSDAANLGFIDSVTTDEKPLVIVQNKIDSIEPKITRNGIEKTVEEVKRDHFVRIRRLVSNAKKASVRNAPIVQVSAKAPTWKQSNLGELGKVLDEQIRLNSRSRVARRAGRLATLFEEMVESLLPKVDKSKSAEAALATQRKALSTLQAGVKKLADNWASTNDELERRLRGVKDIHERLIDEINAEYSTRGISSLISGFFGARDNGALTYRKVDSISDKVRSLKTRFEEATRDLNSFFSSEITRIQGMVESCRRDLNLDETQIVRSTPFRSRSVVVDNCQETQEVEKTRMVKRQTVGGGIKRFFGSLFGQDDWGYDEVTYTETEVVFNIERLVAEINRAYAGFMSAFQQQGPVFAKNTQFAVDLMTTELDKRRQSLDEQTSQVLPMETSQETLGVLRKTVKDLRAAVAADSEIKNAKVVDAQVTETRTELTCPGEVIRAVEYAHAVSFESAAQLVDGIVAKSGCKRAVVCGWDSAKIRLFREWFFRPGAKVDVIDFSMPDAKMQAADAVAFLLFNAEQTGSFKGKLLGKNLGSAYLKEVARKGKIVWVMDSVREHVSGGAANDVLAEALTEMLKVVKTEFLQRVPLFEVMAGERDLYWSVLLHELCFNAEIFATQAARERFVSEMAEVFGLSMEERNATGRYVAQFAITRKELNND